MTAAEILDILGARGVELVAAGDRLRFRPMEAVTPVELEALRRFKTELLTLLQYRAALRRWWALAAQGPRADREEIAQTYQEILRLTDEVGEREGMASRRQWAREWHEETGLCPWCCEPGPYHDPERRAERFPGMPLADFARAGLILQVESTLLGEPAWFVSGPAEVRTLRNQGIPRGKVWTAEELLGLLNLPGLDGDRVKRIAEAKALFNGRLQGELDEELRKER